jgi:hypothetical protein
MTMIIFHTFITDTYAFYPERTCLPTATHLSMFIHQVKVPSKKIILGVYATTGGSTLSEREMRCGCASSA